MKVAIVGAGAIGGWMAGLLSDAGAGAEVSLLARGATLGAIESRGLRIVRGDAEKTYFLPARSEAAALGLQDCVILATKAHDLPAAAAHVAPLCGTQTMIVPAVNGIPWWFFLGPSVPLHGTMLASVDPQMTIPASIDYSRVLGCVIHASVVSPAPGEIVVSGEDKLLFGEPEGGTSERLNALCRIFTPAALPAIASANIRHDIWLKLWGNMTMNPLSVLSGASTARMLADEGLRGLVRAMMLEMRGMGEALGLPLAMTPDERMAITARLGDFRTSMLQDWDAGRPLELGPILGSLVEIADRLGNPAPFLRAVLALMRLRVQERR